MEETGDERSIVSITLELFHLPEHRTLSIILPLRVCLNIPIILELLHRPVLLNPSIILVLGLPPVLVLPHLLTFALPRLLVFVLLHPLVLVLHHLLVSQDLLSKPGQSASKSPHEKKKILSWMNLWTSYMGSLFGNELMQFSMLDAFTDSLMLRRPYLSLRYVSLMLFRYHSRYSPSSSVLV